MFSSERETSFFFFLQIVGIRLLFKAESGGVAAQTILTALQL